MADIFLARADGPGGFEKQVVIKKIRALQHDNIVRIFELGEDNNEYFLALEYLDGLSMRDIVERMWHTGRSVPIETALTVVADAALGLEHAHAFKDARGHPANLVHRDVSPDNIFVTDSGTTKLLDFGIAKREGIDVLTQAGEIKGKIPFMSPEALQGYPLDRRCDIWSVGVILYWLCAGRRPFDGQSDLHSMKAILEDAPAPLRVHNPQVPAELERIVMSCLQKDRDKRMRTAGELAAALQALVGKASRKPPSPAVLVKVARGIPAVDFEVRPRVAPAVPASQWSAAAGDDDDWEVSDARQRAANAAAASNPASGNVASHQLATEMLDAKLVHKAKKPVTPSSMNGIARLGVAAGGRARALPIDDALSGGSRPVRASAKNGAEVTADGLDSRPAFVEATSVTASSADRSDRADRATSHWFDEERLRREIVSHGRLPLVVAAVLIGVVLMAVYSFGLRKRSGPSAVKADAGVVLASGAPDAGPVLVEDKQPTPAPPAPAPPTPAPPGPAAAAPAPAPPKDGPPVNDPVPAAMQAARTPGPVDPSTMRPLTVVAPVYVEWRTDDEQLLAVGKANVSIRKNSQHVIAFDRRRGCTSKVDVAGLDQLEWNKLPRGRLMVKAAKGTELFLGGDKIGTAPMKKDLELAAGTCELRAKIDGEAQERSQVIEIVPLRTATITLR
jgi:serine/threonine-protein kinase